MLRILKCDKDTYITNKIINSTRTVESRSTDSNVGYAGTLDLYKLYNETTVVSGTSGIETTRALLHFDLNPLRAMTGSYVNLGDSSLRCHLKLSDVYGGQGTPTNFTLALFPLAKDFTEGSGLDVVSYRDIDAANWITSSISGGVTTLWTSGGCDYSGALGTVGADYYLSGVLNVSSTSFGVFQTFSNGDENLYMDVTSLVSGVLSGRLPDYGFRLSFIDSEDRDSTTRFVKRFGSRHIKKHFKRPELLVEFDNSFIDKQLESYFDVTNSIAIYSDYIGQAKNFYLSGSPVTGSDCLRLDLFASKSLTYWTSSFSATHSQSINHLTTSFTHFSMSFTGSQMARAGVYVTGSYFAQVVIPESSPGLLNYLGDASFIKFQPVWKSLDGGTYFSSGSTVTMKRQRAQSSAFAERNFVVNVLNLKKVYNKAETSTFRVFIQDYNTDITSYQIPIEPESEIYQNMHWRLLNSQTREVVVDFNHSTNSTKLSADGKGMYFTLFMEDFPVNQVYELEFMIRENENDYFINNQGFRFKIEN